MANDPSDRAYRATVSYIDRTREYYAAQGYGKPYAWARNDGAPFRPLPRPLAECTVAFVTTASPIRKEQKAREGVLRGEKGVWSGDMASPPDRLYTDDLAWDKEATHTDGVESFLPIRQLEHFVSTNRIGAVAARYHGVPTDYSQRRTNEQDAPEILRRCREDGVDIALLVPL